MSSNRPPIPVRAGFLRLVLPDTTPATTWWICASEIEQIEELSVGGRTAIALNGDFYVDATTEEVLEACERARAGDAAAKIIADLREDVRVLQNALDEERERNEDLSRWLRDAQQRANELDKQVNNGADRTEKRDTEGTEEPPWKRAGYRTYFDWVRGSST
jgi:hypothetical protein